MSLPLLITIISLSFFAFLTILYFVIGFFLARYLSLPKRYSAEFCKQVDIEKGLIPPNTPELKREELNIPSFDGLLIHGDYSPHPNPRGLIITSHGYTWTREGNVKYALMFYKLGFSVYLFDVRGHGESASKYTTMGYKEGKDIATIVEYFRKKLGKDALIGIHGESLGASCVMMALKETSDVDFAIEDCGFSSLEKLLKHLMKNMYIPSFFLFGADIFLKLLYHYSYKEVIPLKAVSNSNVPLLIIHGESDTYIPLEHSLDIYEATSSHSRRETFPNAEHALSFQTDSDRYQKIVNDFVDHIRKEK